VFLAILCCFYVVGGLMYKLLYIAVGSPNETVRIYWSTNLAYLAAAAAACWLLARREDMDLRRVCEAALPSLGTGFVLFLVLQETSRWVSLSLLQVGFALFDAYSWLVISYLAGRSGRPVKAFAEGFSLVTASILVGTILMVPLSAVRIAPDQRSDDLRVGSRDESDAVRGQLLAQLLDVHEVAVVPERDGPDAPVVHERLRVRPAVRARRRVARVADRELARERHEKT
jgi:hypothetical protein